MTKTLNALEHIEYYMTGRIKETEELCKKERKVLTKYLDGGNII